jgi:sucrose-6-phosphate hydrolase SacC (GH32 family)
MAFNQAMSVPLSLELISTSSGPRLSFSPVKEFEKLRAKKYAVGPITVKPGQANPLEKVQGELLELVAVFEAKAGSSVAFQVRGIAIAYNATKQELSVNGHYAPAPIRNGKVDLRVLVDRSAIEVFACNGLTYVPMPVIAKSTERSMSANVRGGEVKFLELIAYELKSIWADNQRD